jgi:acyl-CoA synthetase (NDP forming)
MMLESIEESPLFRIAHPRSIAFFGASNNILSMGTSLLSSLQALRFQGGVYPVHPKEENVLGLKAFRSILDLPEVPDLAVIVVPNRIVPQIMEDCGQKGVRHVIVVSGGFKERGEEGAALEQELVRISKKYGIRFLGPNCIGVTNPHHQLNTTFQPYEGEPGFIGMASQSGSFVTQMFGYLDRHGLGFSVAFSVGNEASIDIVDGLEYLGACPNTKVIALYIEGIRRGRAFVETARRVVPHTPIVALYVGGSETGKRAGLSHTGAMAGPDRLYDGVFEQSGVIRAHTVTELFDFCWVLGCLPKPAGDGLVIQTHSGGPGAAAADACGRVGIELPSPSQKTLAKLAEYMPHTGSVNNPVDFTYIKNPLDYFSAIPEVLLEDERAHMLLLYILIPRHMVEKALAHMGYKETQAKEQSKGLMDNQAKSVAGLLPSKGKPIVGFTYQSQHEDLIQGLLKRGVPVFPGPERAARALSALAQYSRVQERVEGSS